MITVEMKRMMLEEMLQKAHAEFKTELAAIKSDIEKIKQELRRGK